MYSFYTRIAKGELERKLMRNISCLYNYSIRTKRDPCLCVIKHVETFSFDPSGTGSKIRESSSSLVVSIFRARGGGPWPDREQGPKGYPGAISSSREFGFSSFR